MGVESRPQKYSPAADVLPHKISSLYLKVLAQVGVPNIEDAEARPLGMGTWVSP